MTQLFSLNKFSPNGTKTNYSQTIGLITLTPTPFYKYLYSLKKLSRQLTSNLHRLRVNASRS